MILRLPKFIFLIFTIVFSACTKDKTPACNSNGKKGDICTVQYLINGKNEKIEYYEYQNNTIHLIESEDNNNFITSTLLVYKDDKISEKTTTDFKGRVLNTIEYTYKNGLIEKEIHNQDSVIEYFYNNQLLNKIKYYNHTNLVSWDTILYYPNQKVYQQKSYSQNNTLLKIEEFRWFVNNTFTQESILPDGTVFKKIIHNTNNQNQIIQQNIYNQNGELIEQNKKTYQNNKIMYESYNKLLSNELLEIIYHRIPSN